MAAETDRIRSGRAPRRRFAWPIVLSAALGFGLAGALDAMWGLRAGPLTDGSLPIRATAYAFGLLVIGGLLVGLAQACALWLAETLTRSLAPRWRRIARVVALGSLPTVALSLLGGSLLRARWARWDAATVALAVAALAVIVLAAGLAAWIASAAAAWIDRAPRRRAWSLALGTALVSLLAAAFDRTVLVRLYDELHSGLVLVALLAAQGALSSLFRLRSVERRRLGERTLLPAALGVVGLGLTAMLSAADVHAVLLHRASFGARALRSARSLLDLDGDGYSVWLGGGDCDDRDASVHPGAVDLPDDGVDQDCSGGDLTLEMLAAAGPAAGSLRPSSIPGQLDIVLVTFDAVRWDHLGVYGYHRNTSPNADRLARRSLVFDRAYAAANATGASFPALLTGRFASNLSWSFDPVLQVAPGWPYLRDEDATTLPERLTRAGFATLAAVTGPVVYRVGLRQGFERSTEHEALTEKVVDEALEWVGDRRFFAWFHIDYPHHPYEPNDLVSFGTTDLDRYDGEIARADLDLGNILDVLDARGLAERTVVAVTADHGEEFGEHGGRFHASTLHDEQVRVPLLLRVPGLARERIPRPVGLVDVVPTLLELAEVPPAPEIDGLSLLHEPSADITTAYTEQFDGGIQQRAIVRGRWKLIEHVDEQRLELFDLGIDPGERKNLAASRPAVAHELRDMMLSLAHRRSLRLVALASRGDRAAVEQLARSLDQIVDPSLLSRAADLIAASGVEEAVPSLVEVATRRQVRAGAAHAALRALRGLRGGGQRALASAARRLGAPLSNVILGHVDRTSDAPPP